jgi:hypothetical protein
VTAALLVLLTAQGAEPVREAVRRGVEHLKTAAGDDALVAWTLATADVPEQHPAVRERLERILAAPPATTRQAALRAMLFAELPDAKGRVALRQCAQFFADNQAADGLWGEGAPIDPMDPPPPAPKGRFKPVLTYPVASRRAGPATGDVANARWAAEGMRACRRGGALFPEALLARAAEAWRADGREAWDVAPSLAALRELQKRDPRKDPDVAKAQARLAAQAPPAEPWRLGELKRTMLLLNWEPAADRAAVDRALMERQKPDGGWGADEDTCAAVFYLHRPPILILRDTRR